MGEKRQLCRGEAQHLVMDPDKWVPRPHVRCAPLVRCAIVGAGGAVPPNPGPQGRRQIMFRSRMNVHSSQFANPTLFDFASLLRTAPVSSRLKFSASSPPKIISGSAFVPQLFCNASG